MENENRIAVFIDADNISPSHALKAFKHLSQKGEIVTARAFGNWQNKPGGWKFMMNQYGVIMNHRFHLSKGKNAADIALVVDAVSSIHDGLTMFDELAILSADSDFAPLVQFAKGAGKRVSGYGRYCSPATFSMLCSEFYCLDEDSIVDVVPQMASHIHASSQVKALGNTGQMIALPSPASSNM